MAMRDIRVVGDPVLRTPCDPVTTIDARVRGLVEDLLETVDHDGRAGLAANQIGVGLRAFSWNIDDELGYVLNPTIVELSEDYQDGDEGCLSVPDLWFPTRRAWYARVVGTDLDGKEVVVEGVELMARCLQHEVDHLDGHLYIDRLDRSVRKKAMRAIRETLRACRTVSRPSGAGALVRTGPRRACWDLHVQHAASPCVHPGSGTRSLGKTNLEPNREG